jgi:riboflavin synthase alpha subunit
MAVLLEQAVVADQKRQVLVPGKLVAGHIPGTAEVVGVQSVDYSWLKKAK